MSLVLHLLQNFFINLVWNEANEIFALKYSYRTLKLALLSRTKSENDVITLQESRYNANKHVKMIKLRIYKIFIPQ